MTGVAALAGGSSRPVQLRAGVRLGVVAIVALAVVATFLDTASAFAAFGALIILVSRRVPPLGPVLGQRRETLRDGT
ncbi:hypothetical protein PTW37_15275 [Arthrobacter agilis]|uniref:hypothetical protein n=1 Tax=Arthrobacter agilis TaxID=37921 RepID=UPI0023653616|nr:hypothetical protein [Arthrobacter agilis]WDF33189.1 hypothetical protein PTW37_15275 [Arthrobacter agilis]